MVDSSGGTSNGAHNAQQWQVVRVTKNERLSVFTGYASEIAASAARDLAVDIESTSGRKEDAQFVVRPTPPEHAHASGAWDNWLPYKYSQAANGTQANRLRYAERPNGNVLWVLLHNSVVVAGGATTPDKAKGQSTYDAVVDSVFRNQPRAAAGLKGGYIPHEPVAPDQVEAFFAAHLEPAHFGYYDRTIGDTPIRQLQPGDIVVTDTDVRTDGQQVETLGSVLRAKFNDDHTSLFFGHKMGQGLAKAEGPDVIRPDGGQRVSGYVIKGLERLAGRPDHQLPFVKEKKIVTRSAGGRGNVNEFKDLDLTELVAALDGALLKAETTYKKLEKYLAPAQPEATQNEPEGATFDDLQGPSDEEMGLTKAPKLIDPKTVPSKDRMAFSEVESDLKEADKIWKAYAEKSDGNRGVRQFTWDEESPQGRRLFEAGNTISFYENVPTPAGEKKPRRRPTHTGILVADGTEGGELTISVRVDRDTVVSWPVNLDDVYKIEIPERAADKDLFEMDFDWDDAVSTNGTDSTSEVVALTEEVKESKQYQRLTEVNARTIRSLTALRDRSPKFPALEAPTAEAKTRPGKHVQLPFDNNDGYTVTGDAQTKRTALEKELLLQMGKAKTHNAELGAGRKAIMDGRVDVVKLRDDFDAASLVVKKIEAGVSDYNALLLNDFGGGFNQNSPLLKSGGHTVFIAVEGVAKPVPTFAVGRVFEKVCELVKPDPTNEPLKNIVRTWRDGLRKPLGTAKAKQNAEIMRFKALQDNASDTEYLQIPYQNIRGIIPMLEDGTFQTDPKTGKPTVVKTEPSIVRRINGFEAEAAQLQEKLDEVTTVLTRLENLAVENAENDGHEAVVASRTSDAVEQEEAKAVEAANEAAAARPTRGRGRGSRPAGADKGSLAS